MWHTVCIHPISVLLIHICMYVHHVVVCTYYSHVFYVYIYRHTHVVVDRGISWEGALELYHQHTTDSGSGEPVVSTGSGFYRSKREQYHRYLYLLALQKEASTHLFNIVR